MSTETSSAIITTRAEAIAAVEAAPWDEYGSSLTGYEIWGEHGEFAPRRVASHFTYKSALEEIERYPWDADDVHPRVKAAIEESVRDDTIPIIRVTFGSAEWHNIVGSLRADAKDWVEITSDDNRLDEGATCIVREYRGIAADGKHWHVHVHGVE